ncbi:HNH endonuclease signature motif containing protein [Neobacillus sp. 179-C4.2 HS]|uniref:HNH endonuclease signature motif containing protein n=1 Tax=Neobacillus driksii TaxID=3035913 RepID=A0ABV4YRG8_9BACI|nr:HNH endonuclease signature motif containing protein [Neobacillus sp. 179.-C4.2 HS]MDP5195023.1 HNH endonuclease signature motif containing protein [Neobacillus sp. 179.-C4.2 HS]
MIDQAIAFVLTQVHDPALSHPLLEKSIKNSIQRSKTIVKRMKKTGDLYLYLKRFNKEPDTSNREVYEEMKKLGLRTYEDLLSDFEDRFSNGFDEITILNDFIVGQKYTSWDIAIFSRTYDVQSGIYIIPGKPKNKAIFIKATLENGKYPNEWIMEDKELKYYLYSLKGKFDPGYKVNQAILNSNQSKVPIYVFIKNDTILTFSGIFEFININDEEDGSKWFRLRKKDFYIIDTPITDEEYNSTFEKKVEQSKEKSDAERKHRLESASKKPEVIQVITTNYKRNPDVVVEVLKRAEGICEDCGNPAPFLRASNGSPYLEVHHVLPLAKGGDDTVENAVALCPNCHRKAHFGI